MDDRHRQHTKELFGMIGSTLETTVKGAPIRKHCSSLPSLLAPRSGEAEMWLDGQRTILNGNQIAYIPPDVAIEWWASGGEAKLQIVTFERYELAEHSKSRLVYRVNRDTLPPMTYVNYALPERTEELLRGLDEREAPDADLSSAIRELLRSVFLAGVPTAGRVSLMDMSIRGIVEYMHQHYDKKITSSGMAAMTGYHPRYFSGLFHKQTGWSFTDYLARIRVDKAKEWLLKSDEPLNQIAHKVGYSDGLYLSRKFSQVTGMPPRAFHSLPKPRRIVTVQFVGALLALGLPPVAALEETMHYSAAIADKLTEVVPLRIDDKIVETVAGLNADLLIIPTYAYAQREWITALEKRMPVLAVDWDTMDRLEEVRHLGAMLGREVEAEAWIASFRQKAAQAKTELERSGAVGREETVAVYEVSRDDHLYVWNHTARAASNLFQVLGLNAPSRVKKEVLDRNRHLRIPESRLSEYAADHMFIIACEGNGNLASTMRKLESDPIWSGLEAVRRRQVYVMRLEDFRFSEGFALERQLELQMHALLRREK
ncbi:helix-turn-helix domain-containing protein [Cohnella sp.]|uniref:helix-turn-helix domain-containing protein n=1 Tax=Cohnella sp. TaxID=1883426 RepID=UPI00356131A4